MRQRDSGSPKPEEVADHYASGYEAARLHTVLRIARTLETASSLLGASAHLVAVAKK